MDRIFGLLTVLRPVTADDAELLARWHADPDVSRYWNGETFTVDEMRARLARSDVDAYLIDVEGRPVGYLQSWPEGDGGGIDMFLIPSARGGGYGPDAARAIASHLIEQGWTRVTVDPYLWNEQAIRAFGRAGFEPVAERDPDEEHSAPFLLMEWRGN